MSIDTLAYSKTLESARLDRKSAEAHAEAMSQHVIPELVTKSDLDQAVARLDSKLDQAIERLENRMDLAIERAEHRITLRLIGIVGAFDAALFALLRFVH